MEGLFAFAFAFCLCYRDGVLCLLFLLCFVYSREGGLVTYLIGREEGEEEWMGAIGREEGCNCWLRYNVLHSRELNCI